MVTIEFTQTKKDEVTKINAHGLFCFVTLDIQNKQELDNELIYKDKQLLGGKIIHRKYKI